MSVIRISSIADEHRTSGAGKQYTVRLVKGTKYGTDETWEQPIFHNNKKLIKELNEFGQGDVANFKYEKNGRYWDVISITEPDAALIAKIESGDMTPSKQVSGQKKSFGGNNGGSSDKMSKAEWAAKDKVKELSIARAVALKASLEFAAIVQSKWTVEGILEKATEFIPFLLGELGGKGRKNEKDEDPLSPPVED